MPPHPIERIVEPERDFVADVAEHGEPARITHDDIELITDKREYVPGDAVKLLVNTNKADGTVVRTLWGELAYQLGGKKAFARLNARSRLEAVHIARLAGLLDPEG